jgi:hypothetical protein
MPSREYKTIVATVSTNGIFLSPGWISEEKMLDELGKQGWQLLNVTKKEKEPIALGLIEITYYFKRQIK